MVLITTITGRLIWPRSSNRRLESAHFALQRCRLNKTNYCKSIPSDSRWNNSGHHLNTSMVVFLKRSRYIARQGEEQMGSIQNQTGKLIVVTVDRQVVKRTPALFKHPPHSKMKLINLGRPCRTISSILSTTSHYNRIRRYKNR